MLKVGLTGGIASGKTSVSNLFADFGAPIIDTDIIARDVVRPASTGLDALVAHFGEDILLADGNLDRKALRSIVFDNPSEREWLNSLLHPLIQDEALRQIAQLEDAPICIVVVPLMTQSSMKTMMDTIITVETDDETQLQRLMTRDHCSEQEARAIIAAQATREERLAISDIVIHNKGNTEDLAAEVKRIHAQLMARVGS